MTTDTSILGGVKTGGRRKAYSKLSFRIIGRITQHLSYRNVTASTGESIGQLIKEEVIPDIYKPTQDKYIFVIMIIIICTCITSFSNVLS